MKPKNIVNTQYHKSKLTKILKKAAQELNENLDIIIKNIDRSWSYVILNRNEYTNKLNTLISNSNKFKLLNKDPIESLKIKANTLLTAVNSVQNDIHKLSVDGSLQTITFPSELVKSTYSHRYL